ncbi:MAG TPA: prolyl oligopeptidase family serine peptidase [Frankiaceae bacterium]|nr:prolyl oligopeptidase family serine peptidase [Frankiaceae bacterium]
MTIPSGSAPAAEAPDGAPVWEKRFRAPRVSLPHWAWDAPDACVLRGNSSGTYEVYTWSPGGQLRQLTRRPQGTWMSDISLDGTTVWWFADTDGDEFGVWQTEPFDGSGSAQPAAPSLAAGYPSGLALGRDGTAYIGRSDDGGAEVWRLDPGAHAAERIYVSVEDANVTDVSLDGTLVCLEHAEHGDNRHPALRLVRPEGTTIADLWDGPGFGLSAGGFEPVEGPARMLVEHERHGRSELALWDGASGTVEELPIELEGELTASWYPDGGALLVRRSFRARSDVWRYDLASGELTPLGLPPGVVEGATARPDGSVWVWWTSAAVPPQIRDLAGTVVVAPEGPAAPPGVGVSDVEIDTPAGRLHALLLVPDAEPGPNGYPAVFDVHGGPAAHDEDAYDARSAALTDAGFAVVRVNYRGSTGYGATWRDALEAAPGLIELEDVATVRADLVSRGVIDPERTAIAGGSWGGFLTLLALGTQPDLWAAGAAIVPVADYVSAYADEMEALKAYDRSLFGGSPEAVPERYERSSPITYVDDVRVPVLILAGENDPRCPIRQVQNYVARLRQRGVPFELHTYDAGHGALVVDQRVDHMRLERDFLRQQLLGVQGTGQD